jgi:hypothetical protein
VVDVEIRKRSARVQVLQNRLDGMLALSAARALEYADNLQGATGLQPWYRQPSAARSARGDPAATP